jgi:hypothetical protein
MVPEILTNLYDDDDDRQLVKRRKLHISLHNHTHDILRNSLPTMAAANQDSMLVNCQ